MKKTLALVLAILMAVSLLSACSKTPADATTTPSTTEGTKPADTKPADTTPATEPAATEPATPGAVSTDWILEKDTNMSGKVNFWIPFKGPAGMNAMIAEFNKTYPNIEVNLNTYNNNSDGNLAVNTAIMGGEVDVLASFGLNGTYQRWANGLFEDITDKVEAEGIDLVEQWGFDCYKYDGRIYTFPCGGLSNYIAINMTAWNEAGLGELPTEWTWDEYLDACKKMTKVAADGTVEVYGGSDYHSIQYFLYPYVQQTGGDMYYSVDGKTSSYDDPRSVKGFERELQAELVDKIWFPKAVYRADNQQAQMTFCQGKTASTIITNVTRFLHDTKTYPDVNWITGFAPYPVEEKGQTNYMAGVSPFSHAGIATNCQDEDAAWAFLKWYSTYGVKYLVAAGHQPMWKGTEVGSAVEIIYGSEEEAKKWIDVDSYNRVVGRSDLPAYAETNLTAYSDVVAAMKEPVMNALGGDLSAADALKQAAEVANEAIKKAG